MDQFAALYAIPFLLAIPIILLARDPYRAWLWSAGLVWLGTTVAELAYYSGGGNSFFCGILVSWLAGLIWGYPWYLLRKLLRR